MTLVIELSMKQNGRQDDGRFSFLTIIGSAQKINTPPAAKPSSPTCPIP
jgi:hypothetical protein